MKNRIFAGWKFSGLCALATLSLCNGKGSSAAAEEPGHAMAMLISRARDASDAQPEERILIQKIDTTERDGQKPREVAWLGLATEETSEALAAQLGLHPGEGLIVTYVAPEGPAAKAGLEKNDVLVELDHQLLVHPEQLKKLIQMHKEADEVEISFYRSGKKQSVTAMLGMTTRRFGLLGDEGRLREDVRRLEQHLRDLPLSESQLNVLQRALDQAGVQRESITLEVKRRMDEVRKSLQEVLRQATNAHRTFGPAAREFQELARRGLDVEKDATVVVKSKRDSVQSIVKTDDSGTYVVIADPKKQLTAHDKSGKLLYDGPIESEEDQAKVPKAVWNKVEPMLEQLKGESSKEPSLEQESK